MTILSYGFLTVKFVIPVMSPSKNLSCYQPISSPEITKMHAESNKVYEMRAYHFLRITFNMLSEKKVRGKLHPNKKIASIMFTWIRQARSQV